VSPTGSKLSKQEWSKESDYNWNKQTKYLVLLVYYNVTTK
jgi:hypothetical protein